MSYLYPNFQGIKLLYSIFDGIYTYLTQLGAMPDAGRKNVIRKLHTVIVQMDSAFVRGADVSNVLLELFDVPL